jgi:hypothetical protein
MPEVQTGFVQQGFQFPSPNFMPMQYPGQVYSSTQMINPGVVQPPIQNPAKSLVSVASNVAASANVQGQYDNAYMDLFNLFVNSYEAWKNGTLNAREDLSQISKDDVEEMDIKWTAAMVVRRVEEFEQRTGRIIRGDSRVGFDKSKAVAINAINQGILHVNVLTTSHLSFVKWSRSHQQPNLKLCRCLLCRCQRPRFQMPLQIML